MPARILRSAKAHVAPSREAAASSYLCSTCALWNTRPSLRKSAHQLSRQIIRPASSLRSSTAVNATRNVPPRLKELDRALEQLERHAVAHINSSRLKLARKGLEGEQPVVRVAVLSLNGDSSAARAIRLLLADPLASKGQWEEVLENWAYDGRGLLIRYGEDAGDIVSEDLLPTLTVPSTVLQKNNIEIILAPLGSGLPGSISEASAPTEDTYLVPTIGVQTSFSGRNTIVRFPVHKSLVWGKGADDLLSYTRLEAKASIQDVPTRTLYRAFDLQTGQASQSQGVSLVDLPLAEKALDSFRESVQNAPVYERGWTGSGIPALSKWLVEGATPSDATLKPAILDLIESSAKSAEASIVHYQTKGLQTIRKQTTEDEVRDKLQSSVTAWSERAHNELQNSLEQSLQSSEWRKLAWWKLVWRIDDVSMIASDLISNYWLTKAEKEALWIGGRLNQAGLTDEAQNMINPSPQHDLFSKAQSMLSETRDLLDEAEQLIDDTLSLDLSPSTPVSSPATITTPKAISISTSAPLPPTTQIPADRTLLLTTWIPDLHLTAQRLLVLSYTTTSTAAALSSLAYLSAFLSTPFEALSLTALGAIYSLRRVQTKWEKEKKIWVESVREQGRRTLKGTEEGLRRIVREGGRPGEDAIEVQLREEAKRSVEKVKAAIEKLEK